MRGWFLLALGLTSLGADTQPAVPRVKSGEKIERLIDQLGAAKFAEREKAQRELEAIGPPALDALRRAATSAEQERSRRASELAQKIGAKVRAAALLAPKRVKLALKDAPVSEALAELQRQSGYTIQIAGERAALAARKVTLDTGDTTFWEAFDRLCQAADLVEVSSPASVSSEPGRLPPQRIRRQRAVPVLPVGPPANPPQVPIQQLQGVAIKPLPPQVVAQAGALPPQQVAPLVPRIEATPLAGIAGSAGAGQITVKDGKPQTQPTHYAGAVRIRALPPSAAASVARGAGEVVLLLDVAAEPRLESFSAETHPTITKAITDKGQSLAVAPEPEVANPIPVRRGSVVTHSVNRLVQVRLKLGDNQATVLTALQGTVTAEALTATEPLVVVDNILKAAGKEAKGKDGGSLDILAVDKQVNGDVQLRVRLQNLSGRNVLGVFRPGGGVRFRQVQVQVQVGPNALALTNEASGLPSLVDANDRGYQLVQIPSRSMQVANGQVTEEITLVYRPHAGQGDPARLVLSGRRTVTMEIPFTLRNVPLQ
jgi:hypothetical protein